MTTSVCHYVLEVRGGDDSSVICESGMHACRICRHAEEATWDIFMPFLWRCGCPLFIYYLINFGCGSCPRGSNEFNSPETRDLVADGEDYSQGTTARDFYSITTASLQHHYSPATAERGRMTAKRVPGNRREDSTSGSKLLLQRG